MKSTTQRSTNRSKWTPQVPPKFESTSWLFHFPGCWSLGLTWEFRRSLWLRFHSILSLRFRYFAKLCNYLIQHHTPLIVFSMEMAPCCLSLMVCGYLYHNVIAVYYTFDVYRSPLSSSCWQLLSKCHSWCSCMLLYLNGDAQWIPLLMGSKVRHSLI